MEGFRVQGLRILGSGFGHSGVALSCKDVEVGL